MSHSGLKTLSTYVLTGILAIGGLHADTTYIGSAGTDDDIGNAANWNNGLPTATDSGVINVDAELGSLDVNTAGAVVINHTAGTLGDPNNEFTWRDSTIQNSNGSGTLTWNMTGGAVDSFRVFTIAGPSTTANISGGILTAFTVGGARLQADNGTLNFTGGIFDKGYFWAQNAGIINLTGGSASNVTQGLISNSETSQINIGGSFAITSWNTDGTVFQSVGQGAIDFAWNWSGSIVDRDSASIWTDTDWIAELTTVGATVDGSAVTAGNFDSFFSVDAAGSLTIVPEPSDTGLILVAVSGMLTFMFRRRK